MAPVAIFRSNPLPADVGRLDLSNDCLSPIRGRSIIGRACATSIRTTTASLSRTLLLASLHSTTVASCGCLARAPALATSPLLPACTRALGQTSPRHRYPRGFDAVTLSTYPAARCPGGGIGRRAGLRIQCSQGRAGSTPVPGTTHKTTTSPHRNLATSPHRSVEPTTERLYPSLRETPRTPSIVYFLSFVDRVSSEDGRRICSL